MKEVKIFARAGQGAITTAAILGEALFYQEIYAYAFPHFGAARMGAPMNAFLRFDNKPVRLRSQVYNPDYVIVVDPTLIHSQNVFSGMKKGGVAIVSVREDTKIGTVPKDIRLVTLPAERIALEVIGKPFSNTVLLGAFAKATGQVSLENMLEAVRKRFLEKPEVLQLNCQAVQKGAEAVS
ncbi:MAG: 2-oxoacid:acceptor oxidoreductase family protein [Candidatus Omnitrophota bacterium]|nr:MAG: 2-oxoacid:acceptor oxidoreductase family protein [Candidatus Omnitrophota bacterium]